MKIIFRPSPLVEQRMHWVHIGPTPPPHWMYQWLFDHDFHVHMYDL